MKNELTLIKKIDNTLRTNDYGKVFPLSPTHRRELRTLKNSNIGSLGIRLRTIKKIKKEEYKNKHSKDLEKNLRIYLRTVGKLNDNWTTTIISLNKIIEERQKYEDSFDLSNIDFDKDYNKIGRLEQIETCRTASIDITSTSAEILSKEFELKFGSSFQETQKIIDDLTTKYEEAINFGDLEAVKKIYYILKDGEKFFEKISDLKV